MLTDREVLVRAGGFVGVPYLSGGSTTAGWDCRGCAWATRETVFERPTPTFADLCAPGEARDPARVEALMLEQLSSWRRVERRPGAVVLFEIFGRKAHVGVVLTARDFIHVMAGSRTAIPSFDARWLSRVIGYYDRD